MPYTHSIFYTLHTFYIPYHTRTLYFLPYTHFILNTIHTLYTLYEDPTKSFVTVFGLLQCHVFQTYFSAAAV